MSELTQDLMTTDEAQRITERIRAALDRVSTAWVDLGERITEAYQRRADLALGYGSWAEYAEAELKPTEGLAVEIRRQLVGMLTAEGMSTRAIAPTVGASHMAVKRDRDAGVTERYTSPEPEPADAEVIDYETGEVHETPEAWAASAKAEPGPAPQPTPPEPGVTIGLDGKRYTRPTTPRPATDTTPKRRPLTDQFFDAAYDLNRRIESVHRLTEDDRFDTNKNKVAQKHLSDLIQSRDLLQQVINRLS